MADIDISKIKLPGDNNDYNLKDATARSDKMDKVNPTGSGYFSLNRKDNTIIGGNSVAEGTGCTASGASSHAEGGTTIASGYNAHAEGGITTASGDYSHSEGNATTASAWFSHAEGNTTTASGSGSHAEGYKSTASGLYSHAEGERNTVSGRAAHVEGQNCTVGGMFSHAEGCHTTVSGYQAHAEGYYTAAVGASQHVFGEYNVADTQPSEVYDRSTYVEIVGNGSDDSNRSNARTLDWSGNETLAGNIEAAGFGSTLSAQLINLIYPVGSIYMSVNNVNPGTYLTGTTWEAWGAGRVPVGVYANDTDFDTVEKTGGSKTVNLAHSHTTNSHTHSLNNHTHTISHTHQFGIGGPFAWGINVWETLFYYWNGSAWASGTRQGSIIGAQNVSVNSAVQQNSQTLSLASSGWKANTAGSSAANSGTPSNNTSGTQSDSGTDSQLSSTQSIVQPYITCYMWKRTT